MNEIDNNKMTQKSIKIAIKKCVDLFGVPMNYYTAFKYDENCH